MNVLHDKYNRGRSYTENWDLSGVWTGLAIQRSLLEDAELSLRLSVLIGGSSGMSGSGMVGADPGLALRLSILLCISELLTGLSSGRGTGSEKGLSDAVRISGGGGGMMGMMDAVGLG